MTEMNNDNYRSLQSETNANSNRNICNNQEKPIVLVDGSSFLYRAYHAIPPLHNIHGEPTGAIYGVVNMLHKLLENYQPEYIGVIFDAKGKNFRHEIYPEYKAHRPPMPEDLQQQIQPLHEIIRALGLACIVINGIEADDVIATLTYHANQINMPVIIATGDKDLAQLVNDNVILVNTMSNSVLDVEGVKTKFGVLPTQIVDYLALVGDSSDNIPGVPSIGPKTASKLISTYGSLEHLISEAHNIKGKCGNNLLQSLAQLPITKKLLTVKHDAELNLTLQDLQRQHQDLAKLRTLFARLEFKTWLHALDDRNNNMNAKTKEDSRNYEYDLGVDVENVGLQLLQAKNYQIILQENDFLKYINHLSQCKMLAIDLETTGLDIINAKIVGIALAENQDFAVYIPLAHNYIGVPEQLSCEFVLRHLQPICENPNILKIGQNLKFDKSILANYKIDLQGIAFDTMLESYVLNSSSNKHDKESLVFKYLGKTLQSFKELMSQNSGDSQGKNKSRSNKKSKNTQDYVGDDSADNNENNPSNELTSEYNFQQISVEQAGLYASTDVVLVWQLHNVLWQEIQQHQELVNILCNIEVPLLNVLSRIERTGVLLNVDLLHEQSKRVTQKLQELEQKIYQEVGHQFNINSPLQLQEILFNELKLPILHKTPKGQPSTSESVLQELALDYPLPQFILDYRGLNKLKSTYIDRLPEQINPTTQRVHTSYNQAVTTTGRLSSTDPNLQNIPIRTEEGKLIRKAFIAPQGCKLLALDYSQIELRIMAHLSQDAGLLNAFALDNDIHKITASEIFSVSLNEVTESQRQKAKAINFGLIYGMSAFGLAKRLGMTRESAQGYIDLYFQRYPQVKQYMEQTKVTARELGYVTTICGRRIYIPNIQGRNLQLRHGAERMAINAGIQGSASDMMKIAMINIDKWITEQQQANINIKMLMQVHDELVFEVTDQDLEFAEIHLRNLMENALQLSVPIVVDAYAGNSWLE